MSAVDDLLVDLTGGDETRAETAAARLAQAGPASVPALQALMGAADPDHRWWAVRTLAQMPGAQAGWFVDLLHDPAVEVRQAAALALNAHPDETAVSTLVGALEDEDRLVGTLAAQSLVKIGRLAVPALIAALGKASPPVRVHLVRALAEIGDPASIPAMMKALEDESALVNHWAEIGLERLGLDMVYIKPG